MRLQLANASQALPSQAGGGRAGKTMTFGRPGAESHRKMVFRIANASQMRLQLANASQALPSQTGCGRTGKNLEFRPPEGVKSSKMIFRIANTSKMRLQLANASQALKECIKLPRLCHKWRKII